MKTIYDILVYSFFLFCFHYSLSLPPFWAFTATVVTVTSIWDPISPCQCQGLITPGSGPGHLEYISKIMANYQNHQGNENSKLYICCFSKHIVNVVLQRPLLDHKLVSRRRSRSKCAQSDKLSELYTHFDQICKYFLPPTTCIGALAVIFPVKSINISNLIFLRLMCPNVIQGEAGSSHYQYQQLYLLQPHATSHYKRTTCNVIIKGSLKCVPCPYVYMPPFNSINCQARVLVLVIVLDYSLRLVSIPVSKGPELKL